MAHPKSCSKTSRSDLISLLSQACEFEHGLACSYLFTSFTLKQEISEGIDWRQQQLARRWANDIFVVAAEEMLHLAQVWNLLAAIGGNPYYWRPNFPIQSNYYPAPLPIELSPFSEETLSRFVQYELPFESQRIDVCRQHGIETMAKGQPPYMSVGELYSVIRKMFQSIPEDDFFIGVKERQVGEELADFPKLIKVVDQKSALAAVDLIREQGEGAEINPQNQNDPLEAFDVDRDGHYGVFLRVLGEYRQELARNKSFNVVRNVIENPVAKHRVDYGVRIEKKPPRNNANGEFGRVIADSYSQDVALLFDRVYLLMLRLLHYVFRNSTDDTAILKTFSQIAIGIMITLIKPLGETLMLLPAGDVWGKGKSAGPAFGLSRHVTLPEYPSTARTVVLERLGELIAKAEQLAQDKRAPVQLKYSVENLRRWQNVLLSDEPDKVVPVVQSGRGESNNGSAEMSAAHS